MNRRILLVDDDRAFCTWIADVLAERGYHAKTFSAANAAIDAIVKDDFDVCLVDLNLPGSDGLDFCKRVQNIRSDIPLIVVTGFGSMDAAIAAIRAGAYDFLTKPFELESLLLIIERAIAHRDLHEQVRRLKESLQDRRGHDKLEGQSAAMARVYEDIDRVAGTDANVLITGESGTGKELVAQSLHARSKRKNGPFVAINCSAVPAELLESELFGHLKGAFTDARSSRVGLFTKASGGTLFLDEVGELPLTLQPKLLRALQERKVRPVGSDQELPFDARLVAATNRDLEYAVLERSFREDLYYRINVVHIPIPPLRDRGGDILLLAQTFLKRFAERFERPVLALDQNAAQKLLDYSWPGNVRELQNCMERAVALARFDHLGISDLPEKVRQHQPSHLPLSGQSSSDVLPLEEVERRYILWALQAVGGQKAVCAEKLHLDRKTLYRKLRQYGAETEDDGPLPGPAPLIPRR